MKWNHARLAALATCLVSILTGVGLAVAQPAPSAYPQWMQVFSREVLSRDTIVSTRNPTWAMTGNTDTVLASRSGSALLLRRLATDGTVLATHQESLADIGSQLSSVFVQASAADDGVYVLAGSPQGACQVLRFDAALRRLWSMPAPLATVYSSPCRDLQVLADGSFLVMRQSTLSRIDALGQVMWAVNNGDDDRYFNASDFAVDALGVIWVAGSGGSLGNSNVASVLRFAQDGARLSADTFLCADCVASLANSVDVLPDGDIVVGGASGSNQPGFFARYDATGQRQLLVDSEENARYQYLTHDALGRVYVLVETGTELSEVRRLDASTGAVLWATEALDIVALDDGVAISRASTSTIEAIALDANGNVQWTHPLASSAEAVVSRGYRQGQRIEWLVQGDAAANTDCGTAPRLVSLDLTGGNASDRESCRMPAETRAQTIDAMAEVGVLVNLGYRLAAIAADGRPRWQIETCALCIAGIGYTRWDNAILSSDGGAWAVEATQQTAGITAAWSMAIQRFDANGNLVASTPFSSASQYWPNGVELIDTPEQVIALQPRFSPELGGRVVWQRSRADGSVDEVHDYPMPDSDFEIAAVRGMADGGVTLMVRSFVWCMVGCNPQYVSILRLGSDGEELWRYTFTPDSFPAVALNADGSASAVLPSYSGNSLPHFRKIDTNGLASADIELTGVTPSTTPQQLSVAGSGRHLLRTDGGFPHHQDLWLIDANGQVLTSRSIDTYRTPTLTSSPFGDLFADWNAGAADAELFDRDSLDTRVLFRFGSGSDPGSVPQLWRVADDGSVYAATAVYRQSGLRQAAVARFSVPGSAATNLIFRDGFD